MNTRSPMIYQPQQEVVQSDEIDIAELFGVIWRGKWWILLCTILATSAGVYYAQRIADERFVSNVDMAIETAPQNVVDIESVLSGASNDAKGINTELKVLKSRRLLERLATEMDLVSDPRFNTSLQPDTRPELIKTADAMIGSILATLRSYAGGGETEAEEPTRTAPADETIETRKLNGMVGRLRGAIETYSDRNSFVYGFRVTTGDPALSQSLSNKLADLYLDNQVQLKAEATQRAIDWLALRVQELQLELDEKRDEIAELRSDSSFISAEALELRRVQSTELRDRQRDTEAEAARLADEIAVLEQALATGDYSTLQSYPRLGLSAPVLNRAVQGDTNARAVIGRRVQALLEQRKQQLTRIATQQSTIASSIENLDAQIEQDRSDGIVLDQLVQELEVAKLLHESFLTRLKETTIQLGLLRPDSILLSNAIIGSQIAPRTSRIITLAALIGIILGTALVFLLNRRRNKVFLRSQELEDVTRLPVMGQIPKLPVRRRAAFAETLKLKPASAANEAYRNLRTSVQLSDMDKPPQVIMSTSAVPGEGKTSQSVALALHYSALGKKVLLVECDLRKRTLDNYFTSESKDVGLVSVVSGDVALSEGVVSDEMLGCDVLLGQKSSVNAADFFASDKFQEFLEDARQHYDFIILDTPPVLVVPDSRVIGQHVDATIFSVLWNSTYRDQVTESLKLLTMVGVKVNGTVLSKIDGRKMKTYGYGGKYGTYGSYGSYGSGYYQ